MVENAQPLQSKPTEDGNINTETERKGELKSTKLNNESSISGFDKSIEPIQNQDGISVVESGANNLKKCDELKSLANIKDMPINVPGSLPHLFHDIKDVL